MNDRKPTNSGPEEIVQRLRTGLPQGKRLTDLLDEAAFWIERLLEDRTHFHQCAHEYRVALEATGRTDLVRKVEETLLK